MWYWYVKILQIFVETILTLSSGSMYYQTSGAWDCCPASKVSCEAMPVGCAGNNMVYRFAATGSSALSNSLRTYPWYVSRIKRSRLCKLRADLLQFLYLHWHSAGTIQHL
jgi:hypothetical protein